MRCKVCGHPVDDFIPIGMPGDLKLFYEKPQAPDQVRENAMESSITRDTRENRVYPPLYACPECKTLQIRYPEPAEPDKTN